MIVLVRGVLKGMGREVECDLIARRTSVHRESKAPWESEYVYTDLGVVDAPEDLPDGCYAVCLGNQVLLTQKQRGLWLTCGGSSGEGSGAKGNG